MTTNGENALERLSNLRVGLLLTEELFRKLSGILKSIFMIRSFVGVAVLAFVTPKGGSIVEGGRASQNRPLGVFVKQFLRDRLAEAQIGSSFTPADRGGWLLIDSLRRRKHSLLKVLSVVACSVARTLIFSQSIRLDGLISKYTVMSGD